MRRPRLSDVPLEKQSILVNGIGPESLSKAARDRISNFARLFFRDLNWNEHDFDYAVGGDHFDRARADYHLLRRMLRDSFDYKCPRNKIGVFSIPIALILSLFIYTAVRLAGHAHFAKRDEYPSVEELIHIYCQDSDNKSCSL